MKDVMGWLVVILCVAALVFVGIVLAKLVAPPALVRFDYPEAVCFTANNGSVSCVGKN